MKHTAVMIAVALVGVSAAAVAVDAREGRGQHMRGPIPLEFSEIDANGDGQISPEEVTNLGAARFAAADSNGDGTLDADELTAAVEARAAARTARMVAALLENRDDDGDGVLSEAEMTQDTPRMSFIFDRLDADNDGLVSEEEFAELHNMRGKRGGKGRRDQTRN